MADYPQSQIGWLGTGRMGLMLVRRLLAAGMDVSVYNRTKAKAEPLAGTVSRELEVRLPNGLWWVSDGFGPAKAGAAPTTREPRTIAVLTSIFVIILKGPFKTIECFSIWSRPKLWRRLYLCLACKR